MNIDSKQPASKEPIKTMNNNNDDHNKPGIKFNLPIVDNNIPSISVDDDDTDDELGDDVELPEFSDDEDENNNDDDDDDTSDTSSGDEDMGKTYTYNLVEGGENDETTEDSTPNTSFETSPSPDDSRSYSAPPNLVNRTNLVSPSYGKSPSPIPEDEPIYAKVDKSRKTRTNTPVRQDTLTVQFNERPKSAEKAESEKRRSTRVSFGEYHGSPLPPKRGIL